MRMEHVKYNLETLTAFIGDMVPWCIKYGDSCVGLGILVLNCPSSELVLLVKPVPAVFESGF